MGTVKMMHMKENKKGNPAQHLKNSLDYVFQPHKCENGKWVGGNAGLNAEEVYENMIRLKKIHGKETNSQRNCRQGYHFPFTFLKGEATEEECYEVVKEFCEEYFQDKTQYVFVVHNDKEHIHAHIIFNSVNFDGSMFQYNNGDWAKYIQPLANKIAKKHGCTEIPLKSENPQQGKEKYQKAGKSFNKYELIRQDIDKAIALSNTFEEFVECLQKNDYDIRQGTSQKFGEYLTFIPQWDDKKQHVRSYRLGAGYTLKSIQERIKNKSADQKIQETILKMKATEKKHTQLYQKWSEQPKVIRDQYRRNIVLMKEWSNHTFNPFPDAKEVKQNLIHFDEILEEFNYLETHFFDTIEAAEQRIPYVEEQLKMLEKRRGSLYYKQKQLGENHVVEISKINKNIRALKKEHQILERTLCRNEVSKNTASLKKNQKEDIKK